MEAAISARARRTCSSRRITSITEVFLCAATAFPVSNVRGVYLLAKVPAVVRPPRRDAMSIAISRRSRRSHLEAHPVMRKWRRGVGIKEETSPTYGKSARRHESASPRYYARCGLEAHQVVVHVAGEAERIGRGGHYSRDL